MIQIDNKTIAEVLSAWYLVGILSVATYELARNGFRYFQKQDVVRSFFYGVLGPIATVYGFFKITVGRDFSYLRRQFVEKAGFKTRLWQNKEERLREILNEKSAKDSDEYMETKALSPTSVSVQSINTPPMPSRAVKGRP